MPTKILVGQAFALIGGHTEIETPFCLPPISGTGKDKGAYSLDESAEDHYYEYLEFVFSNEHGTHYDFMRRLSKLPCVKFLTNFQWQAAALEIWLEVFREADLKDAPRAIPQERHATSDLVASFEVYSSDVKHHEYRFGELDIVDESKFIYYNGRLAYPVVVDEFYGVIFVDGTTQFTGAYPAGDYASLSNVLPIKPVVSPSTADRFAVIVKKHMESNHVPVTRYSELTVIEYQHASDSVFDDVSHQLQFEAKMRNPVYRQKYIESLPTVYGLPPAKIIDKGLIGCQSTPVVNSSVTKFDREYYYLSNFYFHSILLDGVTYPSLMHAYAASMTDNKYFRQEILAESSPYAIMKMMRRIRVKKGFDKFSVMADLVIQKFSDPHLGRKLLETGNARLINSSQYGETDFGVTESGDGLNFLGKTLMVIREYLRDGETPTRNDVLEVLGF